ncbi:MAG: DUF1569 domain-containing protein [Pyrinomonadaceae bacterium]|nr:DUF1569 domain-containing protein [Pyrinomonadaceae bacterium]
MNLFNPTKRTEIIARLNLLTPDSKALWGKMSVGEMICHCLDGFKMAIGEIPPTDRSNRFTRSIVKFLVVYVIPIPRGAPAAPEIDPQKKGMKPQDFEAERALLIEKINSFAHLKPEDLKGKHHIFGKLTANQWGRLGYKHLDHHLRQFGV